MKKIDLGDLSPLQSNEIEPAKTSINSRCEDWKKSLDRMLEIVTGTELKFNLLSEEQYIRAKRSIGDLVVAGYILMDEMTQDLEYSNTKSME